MTSPKAGRARLHAVHPPLSPALIDARTPTPLYHQVFAVLRDRIRAGAEPPGAVLPGEQELTGLFGVSRITVKRALNELAAAGLVSRHRGRGTVVTYNPALPVVKGSFENLLTNLRIMGLTTEVSLLEVSTIVATADVAEALSLSAGALVQHAVRVRRIEGQPFSHLVTHVPADIAARFTATQLATTPLLRLLESAGFAAVEAEQWMTAAAADATLAQALEVGAGAPLMRITRVMRDASGRAIEMLCAHYRPERFQHHMRLTRRRKAGGDEWI
jgi:GntR family transcriptional regulator